MDSFEAQLKCFAMPFLQARDFQSGKNSFLEEDKENGVDTFGRLQIQQRRYCKEAKNC